MISGMLLPYESPTLTTGIGPVHWIENVDGDPRKVRTACRRHEWAYLFPQPLLDPNREMLLPVTCPECIAAMGWADEPIVVVHEQVH